MNSVIMAGEHEWTVVVVGDGYASATTNVHGDCERTFAVN